LPALVWARASPFRSPPARPAARRATVAGGRHTVATLVKHHRATLVALGRESRPNRDKGGAMANRDWRDHAGIPPKTGLWGRFHQPGFLGRHDGSENGEHEENERQDVDRGAPQADGVEREATAAPARRYWRRRTIEA
jgi:hypothetical protein